MTYSMVFERYFAIYHIGHAVPASLAQNPCQPHTAHIEIDYNDAQIGLPSEAKRQIGGRRTLAGAAMWRGERETAPSIAESLLQHLSAQHVKRRGVVPASIG